MSEVQKQICPGFLLKIHKKLSDYTIEFSLDNLTEFMFMFDFRIKQPHNVKSDDNQFEKQVQVLPYTHFTFMKLKLEGQFSYKYEYKYQKLKPEALIKEVQVAEGLVLIITQEDLMQRILFELNNQTCNPVHFELMIMELSGIRSDNGQTVFVKDIGGNTKAEVSELTFDGVWSYKYSFNYRFE